jgi:hypothetical protein
MLGLLDVRAFGLPEESDEMDRWLGLRDLHGWLIQDHPWNWDALFLGSPLVA